MLQVEMRKEFCHLLKIIIPQDVALTILKGFFKINLSLLNAVKGNSFYVGIASVNIAQALT